MLRKTDFSLTGKIDRIKDYEIQLILDRFYFCYVNSVKSHLEDDYFLSKSYGSEAEGIRHTLICIGIKITYKNMGCPGPYEMATLIADEQEGA